jgi:outer membrane protein assembly factor BamE (lipoprotein component of BamABCDE complex)
MLRNTISVICIGFLLGGCVSAGNATLKDETEASVSDKLTEGKTTMPEVRAIFGSPIATSFTSNGDEIWTYQFSKMQADAVNFIPYVGLFGSSTTGKQKQLVILFNQRDVVKRFSMTDSDVSAKSGIFQ